MNTDDSDDRLRKLLQINKGDETIGEGLRLIIAFRKISDKADRLKVVELAERLAK